MNSPYPPDYIKLPPTIACADVEDGVIVTMARVLGLCWASRYRETSPLPLDRLAELVGRSRATLYRHLNRAQELGWLKVERRGRRLVLRPLVSPAGERPITPETPGVPTYDFSRGDGWGNEPDHEGELGRALREAGVIGRAFHELIGRRIDPAVVRAWHLWTWAPEQDWMDNPAGYIITRLRQGDEPPGEFLELARLTPDEEALLREAWGNSEQYSGWPSLDARLRRLAPLWVELREAMR
ncbi:MAG TPA: ArsR family transcriptional regulator [Anaerolineae bacterium]|nr:ArsR family transcriptional regulator [Anaerolineae bacterium]